jgi:ribonuclease J
MKNNVRAGCERKASAAESTKSEQTDSKNVLKVIPLGGIEEVGENMTIMEYGDDILVIDMGLGISR